MTLDLNCANFYDENKGELNFPPKGAKKYSSKVDRKSVKDELKTIGAEGKLVLVAHDGGRAIEDNEMTH